MNILLIFPPYTLEDRYGKHLKEAGPVLPPLGLAYIAAVLEERDYKVEILDAPALEMTSQDIARYIEAKKFDTIGITVYTPMYHRFKEVTEQIGPITDDIPIFVGGPHPSVLPEDTLSSNPAVDYAVIGEGEVTTVELMEAMEGKRDISSVKGIAYRKNGEIKLTSPREYIMDLDSLPFPARHLLPMDRYVPAPSTYRRTPFAHMIITRGCPFNCVYCSQAVFGKKYRTNSPERVVEEIEHLIDRYKIKEIFFLDDIFTLNKKWANQVCDRIIEKGLHKEIEWSCSSRVDTVNPELLKKMRRAGCWQIHYGVESGSQRVLDYIKKRITLEDSRNAIKWSKEAEIETRAYFMLGLPTETREESLQTIQFALDTNPDYVKFSVTVPYPGTELHEIAKKEGSLRTLSWERYKSMIGFTDDELSYIPEGRTSEEIKALQKMAFKKFYMRPRKILEFVFKIRKISELSAYYRGFKSLIFS